VGGAGPPAPGGSASSITSAKSNRKRFSLYLGADDKKGVNRAVRRFQTRRLRRLTGLQHVPCHDLLKRYAPRRRRPRRAHPSPARLPARSGGTAQRRRSRAQSSGRESETRRSARPGAAACATRSDRPPRNGADHVALGSPLHALGVELLHARPSVPGPPPVDKHWPATQCQAIGTDTSKALAIEQG